ncbi:MAG: DNA adenine methylase [Aeromonadaceae bacterium]
MKYMGSKARIAKHILPIILKDRQDGQWYVEPFVGGANMIDKVDGNRIGADSNNAVIDALTFIRDCDTPKTNADYTESRYMVAADRARYGLKIDNIDSYALIAFSFGAKWIGGWCRGSDAKGVDRDYVAEQHRASAKQKGLLNGVHLISKSYDELDIPPQSIIYCDPPYAGTTKYKDDFDHDKFWQWCREKCAEGHSVFISEYNAPDDFVCVWSGELAVSVQKSGTKKATEMLFVHKSQAQ